MPIDPHVIVDPEVDSTVVNPSVSLSNFLPLFNMANEFHNNYRNHQVLIKRLDVQDNGINDQQAIATVTLLIRRPPGQAAAPVPVVVPVLAPAPIPVAEPMPAPVLASVASTSSAKMPGVVIPKPRGKARKSIQPPVKPAKILEAEHKTLVVTKNRITTVEKPKTVVPPVKGLTEKEARLFWQNKCKPCHVTCEDFGPVPTNTLDKVGTDALASGSAIPDPSADLSETVIEEVEPVLEEVELWLILPTMPDTVLQLASPEPEISSETEPIIEDSVKADDIGVLPPVQSIPTANQIDDTAVDVPVSPTIASVVENMVNRIEANETVPQRNDEAEYQIPAKRRRRSF
jgi:hypothetical protein